ncbi:hypothetical protein CC2G_012290 [Coprinopsis cinerea AmutBmut pab1-1]|nr:hypothetical protein CC2G_012290 [Coprinopsis cinerea AmutBmut pab1-1]
MDPLSDPRHAVLANQDLLNEILYFLTYDGSNSEGSSDGDSPDFQYCLRDLYAVSRVCRATVDVALTRLWGDLPSLIPLLSLIPGFDKVDNLYYLRSPRGELHDLTRFSYYARRIRRIHIQGWTDSLSSQVYFAFQRLHDSSDSPLFPLLESVSLKRLSETSLLYFSLFFSYPLHSVDIIPKPTQHLGVMIDIDDFFRTVLLQLQDCGTSLTHLHLELPARSLSNILSFGRDIRFQSESLRILRVGSQSSQGTCAASIIFHSLTPISSPAPVFDLFRAPRSLTESELARLIIPALKGGSTTVQICGDAEILLRKIPSHFYSGNCTDIEVKLMGGEGNGPSEMETLFTTIAERTVYSLRKLTVRLPAGHPINASFLPIVMKTSAEEVNLSGQVSLDKDGTGMDVIVQKILQRVLERKSVRVLRLPEPLSHPCTLVSLELLSQIPALKTLRLPIDSSLTPQSFYHDMASLPSLKPCNFIRHLEIRELGSTPLPAASYKDMALYLNRLVPNLKDLKVMGDVGDSIQSWMEVEELRVKYKRHGVSR